MKYCLFFILLFCGCCQQYNCDIDSAFSNVEPMINEANIAFDKAEKEILNIEPNNVPGPHPDPAKCICKGKGIIEQGDGHVTKCPYHGASSTNLKR